MGGDVGGRGREGGKRETCWVLLMARDTSKDTQKPHRTLRSNAQAADWMSQQTNCIQRALMRGMHGIG